MHRFVVHGASSEGVGLIAPRSWVFPCPEKSDIMSTMTVSTGVVVVRKESRGWKFLLLRAFRNWDFPKGELEPGEDALQAAKREVLEETGISDLKFNWGTAYKETEPYLSGKKVARYYLAETRQSRVTFSINPKLGQPEHHEFRWLSYAEIKSLASERLHPVIDWARRRLGKNDRGQSSKRRVRV